MPNLLIYDGSNFFHLAKRLCPNTHLSNFDYFGFARYLADNQKDIKVIYCVGEIKRYKGNLKSEQLYKNQQSLFANLEKSGIIIHKGHMQHINGIYKEKGVDVRIATCILKGALLSEYDKCYVISSDTDLIPAIQEAQNAGKQIVYVSFSNFESKAMRINSNRTIKIAAQFIQKFS